jgi:hypothetical protein
VDLVVTSIVEFVVEIALFFVLVFIGVKIRDMIRNSSSRFLNPEEFLPLEEVQTLKQVFYLILMALCFIYLFYFISIFDNSWIYFVAFDILLSLYIAVTFEKTSQMHKIILLLLVPFGSLTYALFDGISLTYIVDFIHFPVFIYFIKYYYGKFQEYTFSNGLGVTVVLTFVIVFISFFVTQFAENKGPLDALVMASNAFTSNGYTVLGQSALGKLNSVFLVWGGYIISGAGSATLTAAILVRKFNRRLDELERLLEDGGEE